MQLQLGTSPNTVRNHILTEYIRQYSEILQILSWKNCILLFKPVFNSFPTHVGKNCIYDSKLYLHPISKLHDQTENS
jgi:hypothetical protein